MYFIDFAYGRFLTQWMSSTNRYRGMQHLLLLRFEMSTSVMSAVSKFRGCLVGSHVGDCFGYPFEGEGMPPPMNESPISTSVLSKYFQQWLSDPTEKVQEQPYTDDTAMTLCVANSLIANKGLNVKDMANRFVEEYNREPRRGYGAHVVDVFRALHRNECSDVFGPAKRQFNGSGSYGNGAAMRIAPVALYGYAREGEMIRIAKESSLITHAHQNGYNGAILQCMAIHQALKTDPSTEINPISFVDSLIEKIEPFEKPLNVSSLEDKQPYINSLKQIREIFQKSKKLSPAIVAEVLGNCVTAHKSVPTAIYSFLKSIQPSEDDEYDNPFVRAMYCAVSVGGDTDTIAAMTGSISGAYHGETVIPEKFQVRCEAIEKSKQAAERLYELCCSGGA